MFLKLKLCQINAICILKLKENFDDHVHGVYFTEHILQFCGKIAIIRQVKDEVQI